jgi:hypothetical protein
VRGRKARRYAREWSMTHDDARHKLLAFLDRKAFDPAIRARPETYPEHQRAMLKEVQDATRTEQERYRHYGSARKIVEMFKADLTSEPARKVHREPHRLGLPTLEELRDEFERLAEKLGVDAHAEI